MKTETENQDQNWDYNNKTTNVALVYSPIQIIQTQKDH